MLAIMFSFIDENILASLRLVFFHADIMNRNTSGVEGKDEGESKQVDRIAQVTNVLPMALKKVNLNHVCT